MTESSGLPGNDEPIDALPEVERVHSLLATWLGTPASPQVLDGFAAAHHDDFSMVTIAGAVLRKTELLAALHRARNSRPGLAIEVSDIEILCATVDTTVVRFVEQHRTGDDTDYRRTTAVLRADPEQNRYRWLTVHETAVTPAEIERSRG
ncbi:DUF4440 domain-containing protein [Nocardia jinanensis]|uniref:DUF4440 domain-containing protein n=1 Tax=Nocardia jinanensis TaxID=382504 RepID=A0A917R5Z5_9NOCA|nr:DUF4440 domain-containing protein [Nocardia jinanensis]GGK91106.1 hypothetical protein GCM10011588_01780 [Nocardia jinanensis]